MKNFLVAIDFSPVSAEVLRVAGELAVACGAKSWLVHVAAPDPAFVGLDAGPEHEREFRARTLKQEHRELQDAADALRGRGLDATALLVQGATVEKLLAEADHLHADLVIVGSQGHGVLRRAILGSVTEGVVRTSRRPVLVVPAAAP